MNFLIAIDNFITENIYQKIVDISQKQPSWWMLQSVIAVLIVQLVSANFREIDANFVTAVFFSTGLVVFISKYAYLVLTMDKTKIDSAIKILLFILLLSRALMEINALNILGVISDVAFISYVYFSTCKPPAPPKKKFSIQPALQN